jgi:hypothetical protein
MLPMSFDASWLLPGQMPSLESIEQDLTSVIWQPLHRAVTGRNLKLAGSTRDVGNTGFTDVLRPGLLLTIDPGTGMLTHWGSVVSKATDPIEGVLLLSMKMTASGTNVDRFMGHVMFGGYLKSKGIIIPGNASAGIVGADENLIRRKMLFTFTFDDDPCKNLGVAAFSSQFVLD